MTSSYFSELIPQLAERTKLATINRLGFANAPFRRHLSQLFSRPFGANGSFLSDPAFEAVFGWRSGDSTMAELQGELLSPALVRAMDAPPKELREEYRFPKNQSPYLHQLQAWRILAQQTPQSVVVASGTGSGKTECFMVPILDNLSRIREEVGRLVGVRALFLYPLNALINSQRDRLRAWTHGFEGDVRFCLYNGNTPEKVKDSLRQESPTEVIDRETLRASPPPILVTNATMLEYMLVRTADKPILDQSQGKLQWVVLDEAHTYIGSQAAELALLLRRVLFAFGVRSEDVRFIATSATIGDPNGEAGQRLKRFLAEVTGVSPDRVQLVAGQRLVPQLDGGTSGESEPLDALWAIDSGLELSQARYEALSRHGLARTIRDLFVGNPAKPAVARLSEICSLTGGKNQLRSSVVQHEALRWLDLLSGTRDDAGTPFLPLRAHLFHQTLSGVWACADASCPEKQGTVLDDPAWPFGQVYLEPRKHCGCGNPAYEVVTCGDCGEAYLLAGESRGFLTHLQTTRAIDEFELDVEPQEGAEEPDQEAPEQWDGTGSQNRVLITNRSPSHPGVSVGPLNVERVTRQITEAGQNALRISVCEDDGEGLACPACGVKESPREQVFRTSLVGAPFLLGNILPNLLEFAPDGDKPAHHPYRGRRLLTFNDSRQGTARIAARLQQDAERNRVRGLVYHIALQSGRSQSKASIEGLRHEIDVYRSVQKDANDDRLALLIRQKEEELAALARPTPVPFIEMAQQLAQQGQDFERMLKIYRKYAPDIFASTTGPVELASMFLIREFGRRPKRQNSLETMGMVAVRYPALDVIREVPVSVVQASGFNLNEWHDFLKISLDFFVRAGGSLSIVQRQWRQWLGMPYRQSWVVPRDEAHVTFGQRRWPRAKRSGKQSNIVRLLAHVLNANIDTVEGEDRIDAVLEAAWQALSVAGVFDVTAAGRVVPLDRLAFSPIDDAWVCPFTRRFLDTTLRGVTPYLPQNTEAGKAVCERVQLPLYDKPFGMANDDLERVRMGRAWIARQQMISELRERGLWSNLNDRVIELAPFFTAAEHSAQQESHTLGEYERAFKAGDLNLLSCSTTMEMGIDIGGMAMVAMNNVPPHPANYLQRAGRAGRRREARSVVMTVCKSNPHDQSVFSNSRWAFDTPLPAPQVSLDSPIIVQRHANAFMLTHFLAQHLGAGGHDKTKLTCGWFFGDSSGPAERFEAWCLDFDPGSTAVLAAGLQRLSRYSVFEGQSPVRLARQAASAMEQIRREWQTEWDSLEKQEVEVRRGAGQNDPAVKAIAIQKARLSGEYLLRELATEGFLPAYGFPTHIATFDNLTVSQLKKIRIQEDGRREDNRFRRRELASRDKVTALREYAPGSEVVLDGLVYRSAGVTLNWHLPASQDVRELQEIRFAWRCHHCGASGSSYTLDGAQHCQACGQAVRGEDIREFLEPAGFAVDLYDEPDNDVTHQNFVPVELPWISARGDWHFLSNPMLGRFRATERGHVFYQSRGIHGEGYALCLACGRAAPMEPDKPRPSIFEKAHSKLRGGGKGGEITCSGSHDQWKIKTGLTLGHETITDVLELQLKTSKGMWLQDRVAAVSLAVALRDAAAELLGVQANELGCDVKEATPGPGIKCQSILIFDRFASGYASSAERFVDRLFALARERLRCEAGCDSACPHCILDFDQRFASDFLDRHAALGILSDEWMLALRLPEELAFFGPESRPEYSRLSEAIWMQSNRAENLQVRLFAWGEPTDWDVGASPLRHLAYRLAGQDREVQIVVPRDKLRAIAEEELHSLISLDDHPHISVVTVEELPFASGAPVLAEIGASQEFVRWACDDQAAAVLAQTWGNAARPLIRAVFDRSVVAASERADLRSMLPRKLDAADVELAIQHELDGPLTGFGKRFWDLVAKHHFASNAILAGKSTDVVSIRYHDRYLFSPLSVALLAEVIDGLRGTVGIERWANPRVEISTTNQRSSGDGVVRNVVWADWQDLNIRDEVIKSTFDYFGIEASVLSTEKSSTQHSRLLEVVFDSGEQLSLRLDQGVSYWRAETAVGKAYHTPWRFDFHQNVDTQATAIAEMKVRVEGALHPTQVFVKCRAL